MIIDYTSGFKHLMQIQLNCTKNYIAFISQYEHITLRMKCKLYNFMTMQNYYASSDELHKELTDKSNISCNVIFNHCNNYKLSTTMDYSNTSRWKKNKCACRKQHISKLQKRQLKFTCELAFSLP